MSKMFGPRGFGCSSSVAAGVGVSRTVTNARPAAARARHGRANRPRRTGVVMDVCPASGEPARSCASVAAELLTHFFRWTFAPVGYHIKIHTAAVVSQRSDRQYG